MVFNWKQVVENIGAMFGFTYEEILGRRHFKSIVIARAACIVFMREYLEMSYPEIGYLLKKDHSTVIYVFNKFKEDSRVMQAVNTLSETINV